VRHMSRKTIKVKVFRFNPAKDKEPTYKTYEVPKLSHDEAQAKVSIMGEHRAQTILDVLEYIYQNLDHTLSYYATCRRGECRACGVLVNGKAILSCLAKASVRVDAKGEMTIEPLPNIQVVKDLIVKRYSDRELFSNARTRALNLLKESYKQARSVE